MSPDKTETLQYVSIIISDVVSYLQSPLFSHLIQVALLLALYSACNNYSLCNVYTFAYTCLCVCTCVCVTLRVCAHNKAVTVTLVTLYCKVWLLKTCYIIIRPLHFLLSFITHSRLSLFLPPSIYPSIYLSLAPL